MDPITAFSLACGVIQVVDFGTKFLVKCRQIYKDGASSENKEAESIAEHLTNLATGLTLPNTAQGPAYAAQLSHNDQELLKLAKQCSETATELVNEFQRLSIPGRPRKRDAFRKAISAAWKKDVIENIQRSLELYRRTLDTRILINLSEQRDGIRSLDRKIQNLIVAISSNQGTFDELKDLIKTENASSKEYIGQEFQKHRDIIATEQSYERLLESLYFPDIYARQEGIDEAHKQTFEWIFDKPGNDVRPWHHFVDWLENGHGTYWISGKAGSGKSTLMSFICHDPRTDAALRTWSGNNKILMPSFFFWSPGSQLQKSLAGLLRSIIYQIVERFSDLRPVFVESMGLSRHVPHQVPTWTEQRLRATLQELLSNGMEQYHLCIFIDGLDEFNGDNATLLDLIKNLGEVTRVKFCLSSRPYSPFKDELGSSPMLKLQDLSEPDIRKYVSDKLKGPPLGASWIPDSSFTIKNAIDTMVKKADGVFLWVRLAVKDQLEGIRNGDDVEQLRERLQILPTEIEEVYGHMLQGVDKVYRREVARYIRLLFELEDSWSLCTFALAEHKRIDDILLLSPDIPVSDIRQHCTLVGKRIATTCKGLLEVRPVNDQEEGQENEFSELLEDRNMPFEERTELTEIKRLHNCSRVGFLHRTAFDYFSDNEQGKEFLKTHSTASPHPQILYVKALLAILVIIPFRTDRVQPQNRIAQIMYNAFITEVVTEIAQPALMELIDQSITLLWEQCMDWSSNLHWCRAWGHAYDSSLKHIGLSIGGSGEPRNDRVPDTNTNDFLGFAAWHGLEKYVAHVINLQSDQLERASTVDYLLSCCRGGMIYMKLMTALLKRGADPNMGFPGGTGGTIWGSFLEFLYAWYLDMIHPEDDLKDSIEAFLRSGAEVNKKIYCHHHEFHDFEAVIHTENPSPIVWLGGWSIRLHLSARSILQQCFAKKSDFLEIENSLIAAGAVSHVKCIKIILRVRMKVDQVDARWVDPKLSKQQLNQFTETWKNYFQNPARNRNKCPELLHRQIVELSQNVDIHKLYEEAPRSEHYDENKLPWKEDSEEDPNSIDSDDDIDRLSIDASNLQVRGLSHSTHSSSSED